MLLLCPVAAVGKSMLQSQVVLKGCYMLHHDSDTIGTPHKAARNRKAGGTGREKKPADHAGLCTSSCGAKVSGTRVGEERFRFRHAGGNEMMGLCQHITPDSQAVLSIMTSLSALWDVFCRKAMYFKATLMNILKSDQQTVTVCEKDF